MAVDSLNVAVAAFQVERALEESRDSFAFCTEEVFCGLVNLFGDEKNIDGERSALSRLEPDDYEIRHGLCQVCV